MIAHFEDIAVGHSFAPLVKGPMTTAHIMRWSATIENWHRIHYDWRFATAHDGLPDVLVNGSWKQHMLVQLLKDSLGETGWLWRLRFRYRAMDVAGDTLSASADVTKTERIGDFGFITMRVGLRNQRGVVSTTGAAIGVLPVRGGPAVPYPFTPTPAQESLELPSDE
jgi:acyl dehydratase